jgi:tetraacyldisaccharide 4'-kinase
MVAWLAALLRAHGRRPLVAMRGYKARAGEPGDEQAEYQALLPEVAVLANPDRVSALNEFLPRHPEVDCVLLDDGFQHRRLQRDLDLVLIDASRGTFTDELLPAGHLREPLDSLARADAIIVTHAERVDHALAQEIERWHGRAPLAWARHAWVGLHGYADGRSETRPVSWLGGKRVLTLLGIGNPAAVIAQLQQAGATVMANIPAGDHERYGVAKLATARGLCDGLDAMVVTRKDWVKIQPLLSRLGRWPAPIVVPKLQIEFIAGEDSLSVKVLETVSARPRAPAAAQGSAGVTR